MQRLRTQVAALEREMEEQERTAAVRSAVHAAQAAGGVVAGNRRSRSPVGSNIRRAESPKLSAPEAQQTEAAIILYYIILYHIYTRYYIYI